MTDDGLSWELLDSRTAYSCPGFDIVNERVRLADGTETDFDYLAEGESVVILPLTPDGEVVVIEEWRQAVKRVNFGLPAGSVEQTDDDLAAAARRELAEETGYEAGSVEHLTTVEPANGFADAVFHYYLAEGCTPTAERNLDYNESIEVSTTTVAELVEAVASDDLRDGRTALAVLYYETFGN
jgi:ADP-ribose pyrophosphatase